MKRKFFTFLGAPKALKEQVVESEEANDTWIQQGRCGFCGLQTHKRSRGFLGLRARMYPLTNEHVLEGRCLFCFPINTNDVKEMMDEQADDEIAPTVSNEDSMTAAPQKDADEDKATKNAEDAKVEDRIIMEDLGDDDYSSYDDEEEDADLSVSSLDTTDLKESCGNDKTTDPTDTKEPTSISKAPATDNAYEEYARQVHSQVTEAAVPAVEPSFETAVAAKPTTEQAKSTATSRKGEVGHVLSPTKLKVAPDASSSPKEGFVNDTKSSEASTMVGASASPDFTTPPPKVKSQKKYSKSDMQSQIDSLNYSNVARVKSALNWLLMQSCDETDRTAIGQLGGSEAIIRCMKRHSTDAAVQEDACGAIANLSYKSTENQDVIAANEGLDAIVDAMVNHSTRANLQTQACIAIMNVTSENQANKQLLLEAGGVKALVDCMEHHLSNWTVQEQAAWALRNLASKNMFNKVAIGEYDGIAALVNAMTKHTKRASIQLSCCGALWNICCNTPENKVMVRESGGLDAILVAMKEHPTDAGVQYQACGALWNLARGNAENRLSLVRVGAMDDIKRAMTFHSHDKRLNERARSCLAELVAGK